MSGVDNNDNTSIVEMMKLMFANMGNELNHNMNNNMNSLREDMNSINDMMNARIESLQERIASGEGSRAVSSSTLASKLNAKVGIELAGLSMDTPTEYAPNNEVSMI